MEQAEIFEKLQVVYDRYKGDPRTVQYEMEHLAKILESKTIKEEPFNNGFITYDDDMELINSWIEWDAENPY